MVLSAKLRNRRLATPCTNYDTSGKNVESGVLFIAHQYSSLLGDLKEYKKALEVDTQNLQCEINDSYLILVSELLYNQAWDHYEIDRNKYKKEYRQEFLNARRIAEFVKAWPSLYFYNEREKKYLS